MKIDIRKEIRFKTARSGGKGGQNVNKVETMVEGYWHPESSAFLDQEQKALVKSRLAGKLNSDGFLQVKSQVHRSQLANKEEVITKMQSLIQKALLKEKKRVPTRASKASKEKRLESKKKQSEHKQSRRKIQYPDS